MTVKNLHAALMRQSKDSLIKQAYFERVPEKEFISERKGPYAKPVIVAAIMKKRGLVYNSEKGE